jgi:hypothetical protein
MRIQPQEADYRSSPIKAPPRKRATVDEVNSRRGHLVAILDEMQPMTVRQVFYQATVRGVIDKTEAGYKKIQTDLVWLREHGLVPYSALADSTRWQRKPRTFSGIEDALRETARLYRRSLWADADCYVEIWLEKDALAGVVAPVTYEYDVPLMVARGYASLSFLQSAAEQIRELERPTYIYHLGDFDPSGVDAGRNIERRLREFAGSEIDIHFERLAVTQEQIEAWTLPSRPTKATDSRSRSFGFTESVELDAIRPAELRWLVEATIQQHMPVEQLKVLREAEKSEKELLTVWAQEKAA